ncbi:DUF3785 family protein [Clostridium butyricum]|jgi:hypothetical protein|uniref:DUF3785 domain-containing protein n=3 Tax=root TaxID=1 RepID=A0A512TMV3_CLOBU|nr:DUF3785 family protein [Clostridium butyricum]MDK2828760.1 hypothetical protein [Clostridium butyricum]MDU1006138.1 DUF3785 family protein [Clostridium butyricum]MDU1509089.1 DUF3785 family protein [Clostridium butyricum]MDU4801255.1 DUF3785 family protein [Clostridium butyricum]MDU5724283.1 DUF3785 family protein [Clostridium butyricum]
MEYKFTYNSKEYTLSSKNCEGIFFENDEEIKGLSLETILEALNSNEEVSFSKEYYAGKCTCDLQEKIEKYYCYLEYHFYIYTKEQEYVINTICKEYEDTSFNKLFRAGKIDKSHIVNITVCPECGTYSIEIEDCEV